MAKINWNLVIAAVLVLGLLRDLYAWRDVQWAGLSIFLSFVGGFFCAANLMVVLRIS